MGVSHAMPCGQILVALYDGLWCAHCAICGYSDDLGMVGFADLFIEGSETDTEVGYGEHTLRPMALCSMDVVQNSICLR